MREDCVRTGEADTELQQQLASASRSDERLSQVEDKHRYMYSVRRTDKGCCFLLFDFDFCSVLTNHGCSSFIGF